MDYFWKIPIRFSTIGFRLESSMNKVCYFLKRRNFYQLLHVSLFKKDTISFHSHLPVIRPVIWLVICPVIHQVICQVIRLVIRQVFRPVIRPVICPVIRQVICPVISLVVPWVFDASQSD